MLGILGKKLGMTRILQDDGRVIPITLVHCEPNTVAQVKTKEKDGYPAIVLGFCALAKPTKTRKYQFLKEVKTAENETYNKGDTVTVEKFKDIKTVEITGVSKGKGFQGVVRRYHFAGGPETHGSHAHREPGSIGCRAKPGRVVKGKHLPGHMGFQSITMKKVPVEYIDVENHLIGIKGAVPGPKKSLIFIKA